ncbi:site-2 protease family protein [Bacillus thermotolerans]|uniref:site-2 protease family protein n=1 Tax=Bacillus thermotolerans TaxID=1221996 RepID=UPI000588FC7E|nr:site-2 protease family protein [Bacillus thermotolerans]KKB44886.1 membrane metalloprotease [Bacillus thermotolerans]
MESFLAFSLKELPFVVITLIVAFTLHEFAHAYVAYKFGDNTAKDQGRLTLNPVQHLDPIGTILVLIAGFGWARPVPVNRRNFQNPRLAGVLVSLAGPLSNFLVAAIAYGVLFFAVGSGLPPFLIDLLNMMVWLNIVLFVFNLLPLPPLDGYRIVEDLVPARTRIKMTQYEQYGTLIFLIIAITPLYQYTIQPIFSVALPSIIQGFNMIFATLFG